MPPKVNLVVGELEGFGEGSNDGDMLASWFGTLDGTRDGLLLKLCKLV